MLTPESITTSSAVFILLIVPDLICFQRLGFGAREAAGCSFVYPAVATTLLGNLYFTGVPNR